MNKAKLDQVFNLNNSDEVFSFMKDYAYKNQDLSEALIRHFLPDSIDPDSLRVEVRHTLRGAVVQTGDLRPVALWP